MQEVKKIPIFPLSILPLPKEIVPLHIFEPRYRQLLQDLEKVIPRNGRLVSTDSDLPEPLFVGDVCQSPGHLLR